jgi:hypothetical protein
LVFGNAHPDLPHHSPPVVTNPQQEWRLSPA